MAPLTKWDDKPFYIYYDGRNVEVFTRSALAKALNRQVDTIRILENRGVLRHPRIKNYRGRWCYTRDQITDLIRLAREEGVIDPRFRRPFSERFVKEAHSILKRKP